MTRTLKIETAVTRAFVRALAHVLFVQVNQHETAGIGYREEKKFYDVETMSNVCLHGHGSLARAYACLYSPLLGNWEIELVSPGGRLKRNVALDDVKCERVSEIYGKPTLMESQLANSIGIEAERIDRRYGVALYKRDETFFLLMRTSDDERYRIISGTWPLARVLFESAADMPRNDIDLYIRHQNDFSDANVLYALVMNIKDSFDDSIEA